MVNPERSDRNRIKENENRILFLVLGGLNEGYYYCHTSTKECRFYYWTLADR